MGNIADLLILIGAVLGAITVIYKFFRDSGKGVKNRITTAREEQVNETRELIRDTHNQIEDECRNEYKEKIIDVIKEIMPELFLEHDKEVRKKYLEDRLRYLKEIKKEVVDDLEKQLQEVEQHDMQMITFTEVLKDLLRERIMAIYSRNKASRSMEEHEREQLEKSYESYKKIGGNSYIDGYYKRMMTWTIIPDNYDI